MKAKDINKDIHFDPFQKLDPIILKENLKVVIELSKGQKVKT